MTELWEWIDGLPWIVDVLVAWVTASFVLGVLVGKFIHYGNPSGEGEP